MSDDVLLNKAETIERCLRRVHEIYNGSLENLLQDQTKQDAIILNMERACQAAIDAGMRLVRIQSLGIPKESRECFEYLQKAKIIPQELSEQLKKMVGFRNTILHDYQEINLNLVQTLIASDFPDLRSFISIIVRL